MSGQTRARSRIARRTHHRPLDQDGKPIPETIRQEHYMEARFEVPVAEQDQLAAAVKRADGKQFAIPSDFARALIAHAFLGQLDVSPLGDRPGSRNVSREWEFTGQTIESADSDNVRIRIEGESDVEGVLGRNGVDPSRDGRMWEHRVALRWQGYVDMQKNRVTQLAMIANGDERLHWKHAHFELTNEADVEHLMAGHPIDLECDVRYGLIAEPAPPEEVVDDSVERSKGVD